MTPAERKQRYAEAMRLYRLTPQYRAWKNSQRRGRGSKACRLCGAAFEPLSNRQLFCCSLHQGRAAYPRKKPQPPRSAAYNHEKYLQQKERGHAKAQYERRRMHPEYREARLTAQRKYRLIHLGAEKASRVMWEDAHRPQRTTYQFERYIRHLPDAIKDMRRTLVAFKRWCKANELRPGCR